MTTVKEIPVHNWINIIIFSDQEEALKKEMERYLSFYHPNGYMTKFDQIEYDPTHGYCVTGNRLASCD